MHGVPKNLKLSRFYKLPLRAVDFMEYIVYFRFGALEDRGMEIGVEGRWELLASDGQVVLAGSPLVPPGEPQAKFPIGEVVERSAIDAPQSFALSFSSGMTLRVFDSSDRYESFSIPQLNVYV